MNSYEEFVEIKNIGLAASLVVKGFVLEYAGIKDEELYFEFKSSKKIRRAADKYWADKLLVSGKSFYETMNTLRKSAYASEFKYEA